MKLVGKVPVEPLDDERLTNIERRVVAGADARIGSPVRVGGRSFAGYAAGLVAVAAAAGVVGFMVRRPAGPATDRHDDKVAVATTDRASVLDIGDATIESSPATKFDITRPDGGVLVDMQRGKVELEVGKRGDRAPLVVRAGATDVIVVGTHFIVDYGDGHGDPTVTVTEGVVRVVRRAAHEEVRVAAGHAWAVTGGLVAIADVKSESGTKTVPGISIDTPTGPDMRDHVAAVPDAKVPSTQPVRPNVLGGGPELSTRPKTIDATNDPRLDLKTQIRQESVTRPVDVHEADAASAVSKYREMLRVALTVENGDERAAQESSAYYGIAYLQHMRLGRNEDAARTTANYMQRFSSNRPKEYASVLWLRLRIGCLSVSPLIDCRQAATDYLRVGDDTGASHIAKAIANE